MPSGVPACARTAACIACGIAAGGQATGSGMRNRLMGTTGRGRTAALAVELGRRAGVAGEPLVQAALLHHSLEPLRHSSGLGRLAWQVVGGDDTRRIADIVQVCNLVDEQLEGLEFEYKEIEV